MKFNLLNPLKKIGTFIVCLLLITGNVLATSMSESSITSAASESIDGIFLIISGAFFVLSVGAIIFAGYNLYSTFQDGGTGQSSNKAATGFAAGLVALIIGILVLTLFKGIVKKGLGLG